MAFAARFPSAPAQRRAAFARALIVTILSTAFTAGGPSAGAATRDPLLGEIESGLGIRLPILTPASRRDAWGGGVQSLPYGDHVDSAAVVSAARNLAVVQPAVSEFIARGYVRRPDLDYARSRRGYAVAVLGFQKPGVPTSDQQACIEVVTHPIVVDGVDCPATQVFGGMLRDSAGVVVPADPDLDPPLIVVPDVSDLNGAIPDPVDEGFVFKYSAREFLSDAPHFRATMSPGAATLYNAESRAVLNGEIEGAILGAQEGGVGMIFGAVIGMVFADRQFWISPPDTCGCGRILTEAPPDDSRVRPAPRREPAAAGLVRAQVVDAQGRVIRSLGAQWLGSEREIVPWDGRDAGGRPAPAGVYFVIARSGSPAALRPALTRRVVITP